jgi:hypothetical protein
MEHEIRVELFRNRPRLAAELLEHLGFPVPCFTEARCDSIDFSDIDPTEYRADCVPSETRDNLAFLAARGIEAPDDIREQVMSCTDTAQLEIWIRRSASVTSAKELFE